MTKGKKHNKYFLFFCVEIDLIIARLEAELYNGLKKKKKQWQSRLLELFFPDCLGQTSFKSNTFLTSKLYHLNLNRYKDHTTLFHEFIQQSTNMYGTLTLPGAGDPTVIWTDGICALEKLTAERAEREGVCTSMQLKLTQLLLPKSDARAIKNFLSFRTKNKNSTYYVTSYSLSPKKYIVLLGRGR